MDPSMSFLQPQDPSMAIPQPPVQSPVVPAPATTPGALPQLNGRQLAGQALMAGANAYGTARGVQGGGGLTPAQQATLVQMLRQKMAAQQGQPPQPSVSPQPGMPPIGQPATPGGPANGQMMPGMP